MAEFLEHHYSSRQSRITGLRAGVLPALATSEGGCPIVEWREDPETNVTAMFKMDVPSARCSCLLHYGVGNSWQSDGNRWRRSSLAWNVITIGHLKNLLEAAQHMLGMQHWFDPNLMRRFCENSRTDCTQEELTEYARNLFPHLLQIRELETSFNKVAPVLENISSADVVIRKDGSRYITLAALVEL